VSFTAATQRLSRADSRGPLRLPDRRARGIIGLMPVQPSGTVTLVFTDIESSTRLLRELGEEAYRQALTEHRRVVRDAFGRFGGYEVDYEGDAFFYAFAAAPAAVAAVREAMDGLTSGPIRIRVGIHTGTPGLDPPKYVGMDVHLAARTMSAGHGGQVLLSQATRELVDCEALDLGEHRLKDFADPVWLFQLSDEQFPPLKTISNTNLPRPVSSFVGRDRETADVAGLLADGRRLVTLTGPGGSGKTRLAIEAAAELVPEFKNGVFWVGLAAVRDPTLVGETIAQTLGAKDGLAEHVGERELLLLLDNLEQVVDAAPELAALLEACPNLRLLVTSRELLRVRGEREYAVPPLAEREAVELFSERSQVRADETIAELCRRLDNLPLAVELAAARTRVLSPAQILDRLAQRLDLLKGGRDADPRQQTLRATIEWSYDLLSDNEQQLFRRLAVFAGGCTLDAAEEVCDADLDTLQSLVEKSLLRYSNERYWMLETIREYAAERLAEDGAAAELPRSHALYFASLAERVEASRTNGTADPFAALDRDVANMRAAFASTRKAADNELLLRFATALWRYWSVRGFVAEGKGVLEEAIAAAERPLAGALLGLCTLRFLAGAGAADLMPAAEDALEACVAAGDDLSCAQAWNLVGKLHGSCLAQFGAAERAFEQGLVHAERAGDRTEMAESIWGLTLCALAGPLPVEAAIERADALSRVAADDPESRAFCLSARGALEAMAGRFEDGRELLREGTLIFERLGYNVWAANNAQLSFAVEMLAGDPDAAARALRDSFDRLDEMGEQGFLSTIAALLAHALYELGAVDEADRFSRASEEAAAADDLISQILWRSSRAKVLANRGEVKRAIALARDAVGLAHSTDFPNTQGDTLLDLAGILALAGRGDEARDVAHEAARRFAAKGNIAAVERAARAGAATAALEDRH
jgi:predicted ATPase/class 3 adenylate cyclase